MNLSRMARGVAILPLLWLSACSTAPGTTSERVSLEADVAAAIAHARRTDPSLEAFFQSSAGYAVFPTVGKGAMGLGGAYGRGLLFEKGKAVGFCDLSQATLGLQLGGQAYTELVFLETPSALEDFKGTGYEFAAQATAVALYSGAGGNARYSRGVAVFTLDESGLMYEASIGGQRFSYMPR